MCIQNVNVTRDWACGEVDATCNFLQATPDPSSFKKLVGEFPNCKILNFTLLFKTWILGKLVGKWRLTPAPLKTYFACPSVFSGEIVIPLNMDFLGWCRIGDEKALHMTIWLNTTQGVLLIHFASSLISSSVIGWGLKRSLTLLQGCLLIGLFLTPSLP